MEWTPIPEAQRAPDADGGRPTTDGWFITNVAGASALADGESQFHVGFEGDVRFADYGINVQILQPGTPNCMYHREATQESVLVLEGECLLIIEEQERLLRQWDFVHLPAGTAHVLVGAGDVPCAVLLAGGRPSDCAIHYPVSEVAACHGASVPVATDDPAVAYADEPPPSRTSMPWPASTVTRTPEV